MGGRWAAAGDQAGHPWPRASQRAGGKGGSHQALTTAVAVLPAWPRSAESWHRGPGCHTGRGCRQQQEDSVADSPRQQVNLERKHQASEGEPPARGPALAAAGKVRFEAVRV